MSKIACDYTLTNENPISLQQDCIYRERKKIWSEDNKDNLYKRLADECAKKDIIIINVIDKKGSSITAKCQQLDGTYCFIKFAGDDVVKRENYAYNILKSIDVDVKMPKLYDIYFCDDIMSGLLIYEYIESLDIYNFNPTSADQLKEYLIKILIFLNECHKKQMVHRDIKSDNLMIDVNGQIYIVDWGLAGFAHKNNFRSGSYTGTPDYIDPWYIQHGVFGYFTDLWSLAIMVIKCISPNNQPASIYMHIGLKLNECTNSTYKIKNSKWKELYSTFDTLFADPKNRSDLYDEQLWNWCKKILNPNRRQVFKSTEEAFNFLL